jgi:hypothetical protein
MSVRTELFLVPLSAHGDNLRVLVRKDANNQGQTLPHALLKADFFQRQAQEQLLSDILQAVPAGELQTWMESPRHCDRIVDVFDRSMLFERSQSVAIVRAIAVPEDLAGEAKGSWLSAQEIFSNDSLLSNDCKLFVRECLNLVPHWVRSSNFSFELLPPVFAIQDLRLLVSMLSNQEIDAGNFHRRLKRLDILRPLVSGQRIHRWEFAWDRSEVLRTEGLIP